MRHTGIIRSGVATLAMAGFVAVIGGSALADSQSNFIAADANHDGALNRAEFRVFIDKEAADNTGQAPMIRSQNMYSQAFDMVDTNGDGKFSVSEVPRAPLTSDDTR